MSDDKNRSGLAKYLSTVIAIAIVVIVTVLIVTFIYSTEPEAERQSASKKTAMLVSVEQVSRANFTPMIEGLGRVEATRDIMLSPRVGGEVVNISDNFVPGGFVEKGDIIVEIDPSDYQNEVSMRESELQSAQADLNIEEGRRSVAQREYELLNRDLASKNQSLVLREPQLQSAQAAVDSAQAALNQAQLNLSRTNVTAPFDAQILERNANIGSQIDAGMTLARMIGTDEYWVIVTVPMAKLDRIIMPDGDNGEGAGVIIRNKSAWGEGETRTGTVQRLIGALDNETRLARLVVSVKDPLAIETDAPKMIVGTIVQAEIEGKPFNNVFRINRDYLREGDTLWLMRDEKLAITDANVIFKDKDYAYVSEGLTDGDLLITSNLSTVAEGIGLRTETDSDTDNDDNNNQPDNLGTPGADQ